MADLHGVMFPDCITCRPATAGSGTRMAMLAACLALAGASCDRPKPEPAWAPADADLVTYHAASISVSPPHDVSREGGGYASGLVFTSGVRLPNPLYGPHVPPVKSPILLTTTELQSIVRALAAEFSDMTPVYTYSSQSEDQRPELGTPTSDHVAGMGDFSGVRIRAFGHKDGNHRCMWHMVPAAKVDDSFWRRLRATLPDDEKFDDLVSGLRTYWSRNAAPPGTE